MFRETVCSLLLGCAEIVELHGPQITEQVDHLSAISFMEVVAGLVKHSVVCRIAVPMNHDDPSKVLRSELIANIHENGAKRRRQDGAASRKRVFSSHLVRSTGAQRDGRQNDCLPSGSRGNGTGKVSGKLRAENAVGT